MLLVVVTLELNVVVVEAGVEVEGGWELSTFILSHWDGTFTGFAMPVINLFPNLSNETYLKVQKWLINKKRYNKLSAYKCIKIKYFIKYSEFQLILA